MQSAIELRQLRYLAAIAEEGSFTRAAEKLFVTQSALSQQIHKLEDELGMPLLDRTPRHIRLTAAGELLIHHAQRIFRELDSAQVAIRELQGIQRGSIRLGAVHTVNAYLVPTAIANFFQSYPNIEIQVQELPADAVEAGLRDGDLQLGLAFVPTTLAEIDAEVIYDEDLVLIVGADHPLATRAHLAFADLRDLPMALLPDHYCTRRLINACAAQASTSLNVRVEMTAIEALLATAAHSALATILPAMALDSSPSSGLYAVQLTDPTPRRSVGLLHHRYGYRCAASRAFAQVLRKVSAQQSPENRLLLRP